MWTIQRIKDEKYIAKAFTGLSYTDALMLSEKFATRAEAEKRCRPGEVVLQIDVEDYFKRGK